MGQLRLFFSWLFVPLSSVFTEQLQRCVKKLNPFKINQGDLMYWWDNQLFSVKSRKKFFWWRTHHHTRIFSCNDMKNGLKKIHRETKWVNFVWMQDSYMLLRLDSISWLRTQKNSKFREFVVNTLFREVTNHHNQKGWIQGNTRIGPVLEITTSCLFGKHGIEIRICLWVKTTLNPGSEFLMDRLNSWLIRSTTTQKFLWGSGWRSRRRGSPWRSGAGYFPRSPGCRGLCAGQGAWGQRRGRRRRTTGWSRKRGRRESKTTTHVRHADDVRWKIQWTWANVVWHIIKTGKTTNGSLLCSLVQIARVVIVRVIVDGVFGVTVDVHIGHDEVLVVYVSIFVVILCIWRCTLYTPRRWQWTALAVTDIITVNCAPNSLWDSCHK